MSNEALFFPIAKLPCRFFQQHGRCKNGDDCRYSHQPTALTRLIDVLKSAKKTLDVCVFTISLDEIADTIIDLHKAGVKVRVIGDDEKMADRGNDMNRMKEAGLTVTDDKSEFHMHHKFAIVDGTTLINGSLNWTRQGVLHNRENVVISTDKALVGHFVKEFNEMFSSFTSK